jgi:hypothetical protein
MSAFVEDRVASAYAVPRLPAPMMRTCGGLAKVCLPGAWRKAVASELRVGIVMELCMIDKLRGSSRCLNSIEPDAGDSLSVRDSGCFV